jgi:hypothetical protein
VGDGTELDAAQRIPRQEGCPSGDSRWTAKGRVEKCRRLGRVWHDDLVEDLLEEGEDHGGGSE